MKRSDPDQKIVGFERRLYLKIRTTVGRETSGPIATAKNIYVRTMTKSIMLPEESKMFWESVADLIDDYHYCVFHVGMSMEEMKSLIDCLADELRWWV